MEAKTLTDLDRCHSRCCSNACDTDAKAILLLTLMLMLSLHHLLVLRLLDNHQQVKIEIVVEKAGRETA